VSVTYTNAWCYVELIPPPGKGDPFVINLETFPYLTSVKVTKNLGMVSEISLDLDLPFDTGLKLLNGQIAQGVLLVGAFVRVRMGYGDPTSATNGVISQEFIGFMSKGGMGLNLSPNGVSGTITAVGANPAAARTAPPLQSNALIGEFERRIKSAGYEGYQVSMAARAKFDDTIGSETYGLVGYKYAAMALDHLSWINLALEEAGLVGTKTMIDNKPTLIVTSATDAEKLTSFSFVMRGGFDYDEQGRLTTYPIINFSPEQQVVLFAGGADPSELSMMMGTVDRNGELQIVRKTAADSEVAPTVKSDNITPNPSDTSRQGIQTDRALETNGSSPTEAGVVVMPPVPEAVVNADNLDSILRVQLSRFVPGITATLTTFGIPHIDTGLFVSVDGVGAMFTGIYLVFGLTHSWSGNDIETSLTLRAHTNEIAIPPVKIDFNADASATIV
jgi:hypothetical protein